MEASPDFLIEKYATARRARAKEIQVRELQVEVAAADAGSDKQEPFPLGLSADYIQGWDTAAAFRELYRNWKDAIIQSFHLHIREFQPCFEEDDDYVTIFVRKPSAEHLQGNIMGFIKYDKQSGCLSLVNARSQFEPRYLHLGKASENNANEPGSYRGEGLKFAAIVMSRHGYEMSVACRDSQWTFACDDTAELQGFCWWRLSKTSTAQNDIEHTHKMSLLPAQKENTVCVSVGPGARQQAQVVGPEEFERWLDVTMDIRGFTYPASIIETKHGDILLDPKHEGRVYVKGVLYPPASLEGTPYKVGYNFLEGRISRDRRRLMNNLEEAKLVTRLWETAVQQDEAYALPTYVNILRNMPHARDVELAEQFLQGSTRISIWKFLQEESNDTGFYYCEGHDSECIDIIRTCFQKEPLCLPTKLWGLLRSQDLIQTPAEEILKLFTNAGAYSAPETPFAKHVQRGLAACFELFSFSKRVKVLFVDCENSRLGMCFDRESRILRVHSKSLDYEATHQGRPCKVFIPSTMASSVSAFSCDHIIEELAGKAFQQIAQWDEHHLEGLIREIRDRLRLMPRDITCNQAGSPGCLRVTWCDNEMDSFTLKFGSTISYHIVLHEEKCAERSAEVLHTERANPQISRALCGCPQTFAPQSCKVAVFRNLDHSQKYYPMVALNYEKAFYGVPPHVASPLAPILPDDPLTADYSIPVQRRRSVKSHRRCFLW
ncbi:hypothetical protein BJX96DRAFT_157091 [Aspergillus floccosus]